MDEKPTVLIALKDFSSPTDFTPIAILADILKYVANIVPCFEPLF
jgi:hypothetical protein